MPDQTFHLEFSLTREDWLAAHDQLLHVDPQWDFAQRTARRRYTRGAFLLSPLIIAIAAWLIGSASATRGMYLQGAAIGTLFAGLIVWGFSRLDFKSAMQTESRGQARRADLSACCGTFVIDADERELRARAPEWELRCSWAALHPSSLTQYCMFVGPSGMNILIPWSAFSTSDTRAAFVAAVTRWYAAVNSTEQRVARYLATRDLPCPRCRYNLRGCKQSRCPECGESLDLEKLWPLAQ